MERAIDGRHVVPLSHYNSQKWCNLQTTPTQGLMDQYCTVTIIPTVKIGIGA